MPLPKLPVTAVLPELIETLENNSNAVLVAPPGAGKTTLVPLALLQNGTSGKIILLEPRRLAARAAASRMAFLLHEKVGESVGYRVRMDTKVSDKTRIEVITEGVFTRMILSDAELEGVGTIIFDEFHERSLDGDLGLALALDVQQGLREDLNILAMSATIDGAKVAELLDGPVIKSKGRAFAVRLIHHEKPPRVHLEDFVAEEIRQALRQESGGMLVFLPGQREIERVAERLAGRIDGNIDVAPLYGAMAAGAQDLAIRPAKEGRRKVVLATSIAETSLTIEDVTVVIDCGLSRQPRFEPASGLTRLETVRASKASIDQRAGRAGRTAPGTAIRLWRKEQTASLQDHAPAEILAADLSHLALDLASWGVLDPAQLSWLDAPPRPALNEARQLLVSLEALDHSGHLTPHGEALRALSLPPRIGHMLIEAARHDCQNDAALLSVVLSERGLGGPNSDLDIRLARVPREKGKRAHAAVSLANRLAKSAGALVEKKAETEPLSTGALLSLAWPDRIAQRTGQSPSGAVRFRLANGSGAEIEAVHQLAHAPWIVVADLAGRAGAARILSAAAVSLKEIEALHGDTIIEEDVIELLADTGRVRVQQLRKLGALKISEFTISNPPRELIEKALVETLRKKGVGQLNWDNAPNALRKRLAFLHHQDPDIWPDMDDEALLQSLDIWFTPFVGGKNGFASFSREELDNGLKLLLPWENHALIDQLAPRHFKTPAGSQATLRYEGEKVVLPVRVQELFGLDTHPTIMRGKVPLLIELLSPAQRPVQLTRDLPGFWRGSWPDVRSDMRGRYPKHDWPENPLEARPTHRTKHGGGRKR